MAVRLAFFLINLPFYGLAIWRMGWQFTLRTVCAVGLVSLLAELTPQWIGFAQLNVVYAALFGGFAMGLGLLMLFRHRASLGGVNILALYLQERFGLRAGKVQMGIDVVIVLAAVLRGGGEVEPEVAAVDPREAAVAVAQAFAAAAR